MICGNCQIDKLVTDFINNQKFCYQCEYRIKLEKTPKKRTPNSTLCRMCGNEVIQKKNLKKRQRTVFCSCECAEKGHKELINNHWTRKACSGSSWRAGGEGKWNTNQK